ncbi:hypothetical protein MRB53_042390 [Persea americana]|nr:hypothetical protein MRB53_042390 [Persea americana]
MKLAIFWDDIIALIGVRVDRQAVRDVRLNFYQLMTFMQAMDKKRSKRHYWPNDRCSRIRCNTASSQHAREHPLSVESGLAEKPGP